MTPYLPLARTTLAACLLVACGVAASRAPLGGNYDAPEPTPSNNRRTPAQAVASAPPDSPQPVAPASSAAPDAAAASATLALADAGANPKVTTIDALHFEPLRVGSRIKAELTLGASAEMRGSPPGVLGGGKFSVDARLRAEIRVLKASPQSLDEIELTLTLLSMRSEFAGQASESKQEPSETFDISLSASPPTIRARDGSKIEPLARAQIALVVVPVAEFYARWASAPALVLTPGWSREVPMPFAATLFPPTRDESMRIGPLRARFTARSGTNDTVPFELTLPLQYKNDLGAIDLDFSGSARSSAASGRPTEFALSGPLNATGGPRGSQLSIVGTAKLGGTFSYP